MLLKKEAFAFPREGAIWCIPVDTNWYEKDNELS